jgi:FkbM family methyltransferase
MKAHDFRCFNNDASLYTANKILNGDVYAAFAGIEPIDVIVDIGANIGAAAVFFKTNYPGASIYCFEPSQYSFDLLKYNTSYFENIHCFNYGLYDIDSIVKLYKGKIDSISDSIFHNHHVSYDFSIIKLRKASQLLNYIGIHVIDILKVDTEGCEVNILRNIANSLAKVKVIYLEYHSELDRILIDAILRKSHILFSSNATNSHRGELTYVRYDLEHMCCSDLIE